ncbi:rod shape-determining protein [Deinococcus cellulosilyticus]|uniref:rod shape-determining protein n=1 Tax=Deinococcus cellulosilyticus TaxID=401558 RepID=UPI0011BF5512
MGRSFRRWSVSRGNELRFSEDIGIDLGTATFLIYTKSRGLVLQEPSVIAMARDTKEVMAVGEEAYRMLGRTPGNIVAVRPIKDGVIADDALTEKMISMFLRKVNGGRKFLNIFSPQLMVGIPSGVTEVEKRAVLRAAHNSGARRAYLIEEPLAAAIGAGLQIAEPIGNMVVDIGGGSSDVAVISLGGIVVSESLRVAGNEFDESIMRYVRRKENLMIGDRTAEAIKVKIGAAMVVNKSDVLTAEVRGRDLINGLPKTIKLNTEDIVEALQEPIVKIVEGVKRVLENTPPELVSDIIDRGIVITGGGGLLRNFDELLRQATGIPVAVAENATQCVAIGTGQALEMIPVLRHALVSSDTYLKR